MNPKKLSDCIENSDNRLVQQAQQIPNYAQQHRKKRLRSWTAIAACFALMACSFCIGAFAFARERVVEVPIEQESLTIETLGLTLILPDSWKGRCALEQSEFSKVYQVYNPAIRKALIGGDEGQTGGVLFYIRCWDEQLTKEQVDAGGEWDYALCRYIMTTKDGTYLLYYASDVQCTPETMEEYRQMESEIGDIRFVVDNALNYKDGDIYGYDVNYRGLTGLKKDGSYSMSGGSSNTSVGKMRFLGKLFDTDIKFSSVEQESVSYYLNGKEIDEVTFNQLRDEYKKLPDVDWHEYTESAVKECLPSYFEAQEVAISYEHHSTPMQDYLDSLSDLLYNDHSIHGDNTEDEYDAIFQSSYNGWEHAMVTIYTLCQSKLTGSAKDVLETEQQQWLDMREQAALDTPIFLVTDMTKMRTYDLISFYFDDHFYD